MPYGKILMDSGAEILFEVKGPVLGRASKDGVSSKLQIRFEDIMNVVKETAESAHVGLSRIKEIARPDEYSIKFGLKLSAGTDVILAQTGSEGSFEVALKWIDKT